VRRELLTLDSSLAFFDLFPNTHHFETVAVFSRAH
jgi:hypothetical protein